MAMMTLDLGGEPFLVDEETFTAIRKAESARDEYIESMTSDEDDEDEEFEDEDDYPVSSTVSPMSTMKSIVWLNDSQYARVDSQDALDLYDDEALEAFVGDDGEVQFMTPGYALELAEGNQIRVDSEGIWTSTWRSDAKAKKTTCGRGWIMGPGGKCVRNNEKGKGEVKVGQESAGLKRLGQSNPDRLKKIDQLRAKLEKKSETYNNKAMKERTTKGKTEKYSELSRKANRNAKVLETPSMLGPVAEKQQKRLSDRNEKLYKAARNTRSKMLQDQEKSASPEPAAKKAGSTKSRAQKQMDKYAEMTERVSKRPKSAPKSFNPNLGETKSQRKSKA